MIDSSFYRLLSDLFIYPDLKYVSKVKNIISIFSSKKNDILYKNITDELGSFYSLLPVNDLAFMEEIFIKTFDVQSATTLDLGYVLFGDDYKRGEVLVNLGKECKLFNVNCGVELSDHLPNVLKLISVHTDEKFLFELVKDFVAPSLRKMISEFKAQRSKYRDAFYEKQYKTLIENDAKKRFLYSHALKCIYNLLAKNFDVGFEVIDDKANDFLMNIKKEVKTE